MVVLAFALSAAFFVGLTNVLIRKGLDSTSRSQAILVSLITSVGIFWILNIAMDKLSLLLVPAAALFLFVGLLGPGVGRTFNIISLKRIGVSRTVPITGTAPFFATILAILLLGEEYSFYIFAGMALIIFGIFVLTRRKENGLRVFDKKDLLIPLASAFFGGSSMTVTKRALSALEDPLLGAGIALTAALLVVSIYIVATGRARQLNFTRGEITFPVLAGCSTAAAFFLNFTALQIGEVSVVAPIFSAFPLFGVFLSHFFLKEQITGRTWLGAAIIVLGIVVIQVL